MHDDTDTPELTDARREEIRLARLRHLSFVDQGQAFAAECNLILASPPVTVAALDAMSRRLAVIDAQAQQIEAQQHAFAAELGTADDDGTTTETIP